MELIDLNIQVLLLFFNVLDFVLNILLLIGLQDDLSRAPVNLTPTIITGREERRFKGELLADLGKRIMEILWHTLVGLIVYHAYLLFLVRSRCRREIVPHAPLILDFQVIILSFLFLMLNLILQSLFSRLPRFILYFTLKYWVLQTGQFQQHATLLFTICSAFIIKYLGRFLNTRCWNFLVFSMYNWLLLLILYLHLDLVNKLQFVVTFF